MHAKPPPTFLLPEIVTFMTVLSSTPRTYCSTRPRPLTTPSKGRSVSPFLAIYRHVEISHGGERGPAGIVCSSPRSDAPLIASTYRPNASAIHIYTHQTAGQQRGGYKEGSVGIMDAGVLHASCCRCCLPWPPPRPPLPPRWREPSPRCWLLSPSAARASPVPRVSAAVTRRLERSIWVRMVLAR